MIDILDHYYSVNHEKYCVIVKSDKFIQDIIEIYSAIEFLLEEIVDEGALLEERCLLKILEDFYEAENIKDLFSDEELSLIDMPIDGLYMGTVVSYGQMVADEAYIIDLYTARESQCGYSYRKIMKKWLPKGKDLDKLKNLLITEGDERFKDRINATT